MNARPINLILFIFILMTLSGCDLIEGVFKMGIWLTIFAIVIVIAILVLIFNSVSYRPNDEGRATQRMPDSP